MPRKKRTPLTEQPESPETAATLSDVLRDLDPTLAAVPTAEEIPETPPPRQIVTPVSVLEIPSDIDEEAREYLRRQVYKEFYGTETPESHDRTQLSIKLRSLQYGRRNTTNS